MGIFDALTGSAYDRSAKANGAAVTTGLNQSGAALQGTAQSALGYLLDGTNPSAMTALQGGYGQARNDIAGQYGQTQGYLGQQGDLYNHMAAGGQNAYDAYLNATGANGAAGSAAATAAFQSAPGYQYQQDQALDAVQRSAAARGGLAGGNATADILKTATGLADQSYQQYVSNLGNAASSYGTALGGQAASLGAQASASQNQGTALGALGTGLGQNTASLYGLGANVQTNLGNQISGNVNSATNALVNSNNARAQGQTAASSNLLGGVLGGASSLFGAAGKAGGFGNLFS